MALTEMQEFGNIKEVSQVTDQLVEDWVKSATRCSVEEQPEQVHDALTRVKFTSDSADPRGACLEFFANVYTELRRNKAQEIIDHNPKVLIELLIKKLEPSPLKIRMQRSF